MVSSAFLVRNVVDLRHLQMPVSLHPRQTLAAVSWELEARAGLEERGRTLQLGFNWEVAACGALDSGCISSEVYRSIEFFI